MKLFTTLIATAVSVATVAISAPAHALIFTQWDFNDNSIVPANNLTPNSGTGTASLVGTTTGSFAAGAVPAENPNYAWLTANYPTQSNSEKTAGVKFATSTVGYQNIIVSWFQRNSPTASAYTQFQYSIDGSTFVDFGTPLIASGNGTFLSNSIDLSNITGVNNNSNFAFRLVSAFAPATSNYAPTSGSSYGTGGTWRFDTVTANGDTFSAAPVPFDIPGGATIPTVGSLLALGAMRKARKTIASKIANPAINVVS